MPDLLAGEVIEALDTPPAGSDREDGSFTATITAFGVAAASGTYADCACTFVAGTTGRVVLLYSARMANSAAGQCLVSPEVRDGSTIGAGGVRQSAATELAVVQIGTSGFRASGFCVLTGLTAGSTYNARLLHMVTSGTGTFLHRNLAAIPTS